jgi:hypothetical protein
MGKAPQILKGLAQASERLREKEREFVLDAGVGELTSEIDPDDEPQVRPRPVPVARQTFD